MSDQRFMNIAMNLVFLIMFSVAGCAANAAAMPPSTVEEIQKNQSFFEEVTYKGQVYTKINGEVFWIYDNNPQLDSVAKSTLQACKIMYYPYPKDAQVIIFNGFNDQNAPWFSQRLVRFEAESTKLQTAHVILCSAKV